MRKSRFSETQIIGVLNEVEASGDWESPVPPNLAAEDINYPKFAGVGGH